MTEVSRRVVWASRLGAALLRALALTWRVRFANGDVTRDMRQRKQPVIYALWHGNLLPLLFAHRNRGIAVMISEHSDGEIIARIAQHLGFGTVRGSTSRGAARALLNACREVEAGHDLAVTPDGPRGPAHSVAPGTLVIAQRTGAPVLPVFAGVSRAWQLRSWDRFMIPKPFATVTVAYGPLLWVATDTPRDAINETERVRQGITAAYELAKEA
ncbi:MAG: lysophospholipid acyltransferase family protein [Gemmatimonadaceae bacterium]